MYHDSEKLGVVLNIYTMWSHQYRAITTLNILMTCCGWNLANDVKTYQDILTNSHTKQFRVMHISLYFPMKYCLTYFEKPWRDWVVILLIIHSGISSKSLGI